MRKEAYLALIAVLLIWIQFGCNPVNQEQVFIGSHPVEAAAEVNEPTVLVGAFNIQQFGVTKIGRNDVTRVLVDIVRRFDLLAIQELRSVDQTVIPRFLELLNATGMNYKAIISPRLGHTTQKEQLVYIYDANKFVPTGTSFVAPDLRNIMHRSLYVTSFRCKEPSPERAFTFTLMNVHVDPDEIRFEVPELNRIGQNVVSQLTHEDDFIVLGDFNVPADYLKDYSMLSNQIAVVPPELATNTRGYKSIDNIVMDSEATTEFLGRGGVLDFATEYGLSLEEALYVSDHLPVWAEFSVFEDLPTTLATPAEPVLRR